MKGSFFFQAILSAVFFISGCAAAASSSRRRYLRRSRSLVTLDGDVEACIEVKGGSATKGNSLVLGDCSNYRFGIDGIYARDEESSADDAGPDALGLFMYVSRLDSEMCVQAGHPPPEGASSPSLESGTKMRVYPCDASNPLQIFVIHRGDDVRLAGTNWCVAYRGIHADVGLDHLMLKDCDKLSDEGYGWSYD